MNIEKVIIFMPSMQGGGAEHVISTIANYCIKQGKKVDIILLEKNVVAYELSPDVKVHYSEIWNNEVGLKVYNRIKYIRSIIKSERDICVLSFFGNISFYIVMANFLIGKKTVFSIRNDPKHCLGKSWIEQTVIKFIHRFARHVVFQTPDAAKCFSKSVQKNSAIISNPICDNIPDVFKGERVKTFVTFGRLEPQKNIGMIISAFAKVHCRYPEYRLEIYGDGSEKEKLEVLCKTLNVQDCVHIMGFQKNIHNIIKDKFAYISASNYEGISNSMIESLALGLPCICTDCPIGGAKMVIKNGRNGLLIPVGDEQALVVALSRIIDDGNIRDNMEVEAHDIRKELNSEVICKQWYNILIN